MKKILIFIFLLLVNSGYAGGWDPVGLGGWNNRIHDLKVYGTKLYAAVDGNSGGDVHYSNNLGQFTNISSNIPGFAQCFSVAAINDLVFGYFGDGVYITTNNGLGWTLLAMDDTPPEEYLPDEENRGGNPIFKTFNNKLYMGLKVSADSGFTWTTLNNGIIPNKVPSIFYMSDTLFLGFWKSENTGIIYRSTNEGNSWTPTAFSLPVWTHQNIGPAFFYKNKIYLEGGSVFRPEIYVSTNGGANFYYLSSVTGRTGVSCFEGYENLLFCGTDSSILLSRNEGVSWENISGVLQIQLESPGIGLIKIYQNTHVLVTHSERGVQKRPLSDFNTTGIVGAELVKNYTLSQNYPNPFNPSTSINYYLPQSEHVIIKVFDASGKEVQELVNENKPTGLHIVNFNGAGLSSGVYFYRIRAGEFSETKKMLLVK